MAEQESDRPLGFRICDCIEALIAQWKARQAEDLPGRLAWPLNSHTDGWGELLDSLHQIQTETTLPTEEQRHIQTAVQLLQTGFGRQADQNRPESESSIDQ